MSAEFQSGEVFTDVAPGKTMTSTRANNLINGAKLLVGAVSNKTEMTDPVAAGDMFLLQDVSDVVTGEPKKVQAQNALPEIVRNQSQLYAAGTQSGGVYAVTLAPAATAYTAGMVVRFIADSANTAAVSANVNALGNKNIFNRAGAALAANDILANQIVELVYDGTRFLMTNALSAAQVTASHVTESLRSGVSQYIADSGVAANVYAATLVPAATTYGLGMVVRFKAANANTAASTLNVNALGAKTIKKNGTADLLANDILANQIVTVVYDGTNFQLTGTAKSPDFVSAEQAVTLSGVTVAVAHGLGFTPTRVRWVLRCKTAELGFAIGDELDVPSAGDSGNQGLHQMTGANATNVFLLVRGTNNLQVLRYDTQAYATITAADWKFVCYASL